MRNLVMRPLRRVYPCGTLLFAPLCRADSHVTSRRWANAWEWSSSSRRDDFSVDWLWSSWHTRPLCLGRDGQLHSLDPRVRDEVRGVGGSYIPLSPIELRNQLSAEFGRSYEVIATNNFLVVQPKGRGNRWPTMFEQSHRSFTTYMSKRGVTVREGRFPMVAVVFPDQRAMYAEFKKQKIDVSRVAGVYLNHSNRVLTHDGGHTELIAATVRHEAAHQSAFNSGVHSRLNDTPRWITEGIGQMFEPAAMASVSQSGSSVA